jgi:hypothetical protein
LLEKPTPANVGEVVADARADDLLDHDPHLLGDVEEPPLGAVLERGGPEDRGVDLGDGVHERREPVLLRTLVREEEALVLAGEGRPRAVLQEARAAHDDGAFLEVVERDGEPLDDLGRELAVLEDLDDVRVLAADLVDLEVLPVDDVLEVVVRDEVDDAVRRDVPGLRDPDVLERLGVLLRLADDLHGEEEPAALSSHLPVARRGADDPPRQLEEVGDLDVVLGDADELELVGQETAHERGAQVELDRPREVPVVQRGVLEPGEGLRDVGEGRPLVLERLDEEARAAVLDPALDARPDLPGRDVRRGDHEDLLGHLQEGVEVPARHRPVLVRRLLRAGRPAPAPGEAREEPLGLLDAAVAEEVEHPPRDRHVAGPVDLAEEVDDDPPVSGVGLRRPSPLLGPAEGGGELPLQEELPEELGERVEEPPLLLQERALVGRRERGAVVDLQAPDLFALHPDRRRLDPRGGAGVARLVDRRSDDEPHERLVRVLPADRQDADDLAEEILQGRFRAAADRVDPIEAVELLGPLLQLLEQRSTGSGHRILQGRPRRRRRSYTGSGLRARTGFGAHPGEPLPFHPESRGSPAKGSPGSGNDQAQPRSLQAFATRETAMT